MGLSVNKFAGAFIIWLFSDFLLQTVSNATRTQCRIFEYMTSVNINFDKQVVLRNEENISRDSVGIISQV